MTSPPKSAITRDHVEDAARIWIAEPKWGGFGNSTRYDVRIGRGRYPPKAICAIANWLATGEVLEPGDFPGAFDGPWHQAITTLGFKIVPKIGQAAMNQAHQSASILDFRDDRRLDECGRGFLVTGKPEHDKMNREFLQNDESGHWIFAEGRAAERGDAIFVLLPHPTAKGGYPRALHAGVLDAIPKRDDRFGAVKFTVKKFRKLTEIDADIRGFLGGRLPPQGNTVLTLWDDEASLKKFPPGGGGTGDDGEDYPEGKAHYRLHRSKERSRKLIRRAKAHRFEKTGKLECEVCSFDFAVQFGKEGAGYIEGHHTVPVKSLTGKTRTKVTEIALVCANCHRMLHLMKSMSEVEDLRAHVAATRKPRARLNGAS